MPDRLEDWLASIPPAYRERCELLAKRTLADPAQLRATLEAHLEVVEQLAPLVPGLDLYTWRLLGERAFTLLDLWPELSLDKQVLVQVVVNYLTEEADDEEVTGVLGLADDIAVINVALLAADLGEQRLLAL